jgi:hypothetical protein
VALRRFACQLLDPLQEFGIWREIQQSIRLVLKHGPKRWLNRAIKRD